MSFENNRTDQISKNKYPPTSSQLGVVKEKQKFMKISDLVKSENMTAMDSFSSLMNIDIIFNYSFQIQLYILLFIFLLKSMIKRKRIHKSP